VGDHLRILLGVVVHITFLTSLGGVMCSEVMDALAPAHSRIVYQESLLTYILAPRAQRAGARRALTSTLEL
jgi:hypothetical protein